MSQSAADIASEFLAVLWDGEAPDDATLSRALDRLLARSHDVGGGHPAGSDDDPPEPDGPLYREVGDRFPDYGMYPIADPIAAFDDDRMLADAIDDIIDLTRDLREVVWRDTHRGPDDAAWYFRLLFFHWAAHARGLSLYLHARQFG